jgi:peptidoglycan/xylan/chitin deacetylase (PgdA/CDA1 family)
VSALVLCYHAVSARWEHRLSIPPATLERQLRGLLARRFRPVDAAGAVSGGGRLLHVTFDDAYRSVANALPALERCGIPATVFACSGIAGEPLAVPELADEAAARPEELRTMDWDELAGLVERGVEIGSHTVSHPHLPRLSDEELRRELVDSRAELEDRLGRRCRYLAYPFGDEDGRVHAVAESAGYEAAFALPGNESVANRFAVPRVGVYPRDNAVRLALKTSATIRRPAATLLRAVGRRR